MPDLNIKSSTIEKGLDLVKGFLERAIGPSVDELGLTWSDAMRRRRAGNQLKSFQKMKQIAEDGNVDIKQINLKALFPLLEGIALEEDDTLQDMWANLFVNYIDASKNLTAHVYPSILKQLSSEDVNILKQMQVNRNQIDVKTRSLMRKTDKPFAFDDQLTNLARLGVIAGIPIFKGVLPTKVV